MIDLNISIAHGNTLYTPAVLDGVSWETENGMPGKFLFSILSNPNLLISEGDAVKCMADGKPVFYGYIFTRRQTEKGFISITAYDQTRYLKNRDTYVYDGITASSLLRKIAADHGLKLGKVADTAVLLEPRAEDNKTLFDILRNALDYTEKSYANKRFVLYDDFGSLSLQSTEDTRLDLLLDLSAAQSFTRSVSIDGGTFNTIKLICDKKGSRSVFTAADPLNIARWGKLQYFGKIAEDYNGSEKASSLLKLYNREQRELTAEGVPGDPRARAGCSLWISPALSGRDDTRLYSITHARHLWREGGYFMDLSLTEV